MGTYLFFASGPRPNDRASRPRTIPIAAQLRKPSRTFVQSGFNEVALTPAIRATLCHATSQNPPDSLRPLQLFQILSASRHARTRQNPVKYTNRILGILPRRPPYSGQQKEDQSNRSWEAPGAILNRAGLPQKHAVWRHKPPYGRHATMPRFHSLNRAILRPGSRSGCPSCGFRRHALGEDRVDTPPVVGQA